MSGKTQRSLVPTAVVILFLCCLNGVDLATPRTLQTSLIELPQIEQSHSGLPDFTSEENDFLELDDRSEQAISAASKTIEPDFNNEVEKSLNVPERITPDMQSAVIAEGSHLSTDAAASTRTIQLDSNGPFDRSKIDINTALNDAVEEVLIDVESGLPDFGNEPSSLEPDTHVELHSTTELLFHDANPFLGSTASESTSRFASDEPGKSEADGSYLFNEKSPFTSIKSPALLKAPANQPNNPFTGIEIFKFAQPSLEFNILETGNQNETDKNFLDRVALQCTSRDSEFLRTGFKDFINGTRQLKLSNLNLLLDRLSVHGSLFVSSGRIQISKFVEFRGNFYADMAGLNARGEYKLYLTNLPLVNKVRIASRYFQFSSPTYGFHEPGLGRGFKINVNDFSLSDMRFLSFAEFQFPPFLGSRGIVSSVIHNRFNGFELRLLIDLPNITFKDVPGKLRLPNYDWRFR